MKLVDEGLKKVFEKSNITDFPKAYGYMISGGYTRAEAMSNALYYYKLESVNDYDLIIVRRNHDMNTKASCGSSDGIGVVEYYDTLEFYKLINIPHLAEYIGFCLSHQNKDVSMIHEEAYTKVIQIDNINVVDFDFITKDYKGVVSKIVTQSDSYSNHNGVINGDAMMDADGDVAVDDIGEEVGDMEYAEMDEDVETEVREVPLFGENRPMPDYIARGGIARRNDGNVYPLPNMTEAQRHQAFLEGLEDSEEERRDRAIHERGMTLEEFHRRNRIRENDEDEFVKKLDKRREQTYEEILNSINDKLNYIEDLIIQRNNRND